MIKQNKNLPRLSRRFKTFSLVEKSLPDFINGDDDESREFERENPRVLINESKSKSLNSEQVSASDQETLPINDYMKLVKSEVDRQKAQRQKLLRRRLENIRSEINYRRKVAMYPLYIFPEEIWIQILEHVTDPKDIENLTDSSPYFSGIMKHSRVERLFEKVFPLIRNELYYDDIQACSLVCKQWYNTMDKILDQYFIIDDRQYSSYSNDVTQVLEQPKAKLSSIFYCIFCEDSIDLNLRLRMDGGHTCYCWDYYYVDYDAAYLYYAFDYWRWVPCVSDFYHPFATRFVTVNVQNEGYENYFHEFLIEFGSQVCYLDLSLDMPISKMLEYCSRLKRLRIRDSQIEYGKDVTCNTLGPLPDHACLQHLEMELTGGTVAFQDRLFQRYSSQLKQVRVERWNHKLYHHLNWDNLRILDAIHFKHVHVFRSLTKLNAPNLKYFSIWFREVEECRVETLMHFVNRFPKLETLHLKFPDKFQGFPHNELVSTSPGFTCSNSLAKLVIEINKRNFSAADKLRNFLLCFPFLRKLKIVLYQAPDQSHLDGDSIFDTSLNRKKLKGNKFQISRFILNHHDVDSIYKSYIWEVIPSLQTLTLRDCNFSKVFERIDCNTFKPKT